MQPHKIRDTVSKKAPDSCGADTRMVTNMALAVADVVHESCDLEFQVIGGRLGEHVRALQSVVDLAEPWGFACHAGHGGDVRFQRLQAREGLQGFIYGNHRFPRVPVGRKGWPAAFATAFDQQAGQGALRVLRAPGQLGLSLLEDPRRARFCSSPGRIGLQIKTQSPTVAKVDVGTLMIPADRQICAFSP